MILINAIIKNSIFAVDTNERLKTEINMGKKKFYVVWKGEQPGIYSSWAECQLQIKGYEDAQYKSFDSREDAERAYASSPFQYIGKTQWKEKVLHNWQKIVSPETLVVDAACSGNPGPMEYRGVYLRTGEEVFHFGPMLGTNNIGEFLAIVHALALLKQKSLKMPIYSDSRTAISWVKQKKCKTKLSRTPETEELFQLIERAEKWLQVNRITTPICKWETQEWGEIPADFGRK